MPSLWIWNIAWSITILTQYTMFSIYFHQTEKPLLLSVDFKNRLGWTGKLFKFVRIGSGLCPTFILCACSDKICDVLEIDFIISTHKVFIDRMIKLLIFWWRPLIKRSRIYICNFSIFSLFSEPGLALSPRFSCDKFCNFFIISSEIYKSIK